MGIAATIESTVVLKVESTIERGLLEVKKSWKYSQTCSNDHICKTATHLRRPMLSLPKPIPIQLLLYKTTTCLTQPATTCFVPQIKKKPF